MALLKKPLKPHAATCVKKALLECVQSSPNHCLAYLAFCDREDCWNCDEIVGNYICAVNLMEQGDTVGQRIHSNHCKTKNTLRLEVQVFARGCFGGECGTPADTALSVLADVTQTLMECNRCGNVVDGVDYSGFERQINTDSSELLALVTGFFNIRYTFDPYDPCTYRHKDAGPQPKPLWYERN